MSNDVSEILEQVLSPNLEDAIASTSDYLELMGLSIGDYVMYTINPPIRVQIAGTPMLFGRIPIIVDWWGKEDNDDCLQLVPPDMIEKIQADDATLGLNGADNDLFTYTYQGIIEKQDAQKPLTERESEFIECVYMVVELQDYYTHALRKAMRAIKDIDKPFEPKVPFDPSDPSSFLKYSSLI